MAVASGNQYLNRNNLHFAPVSARLYRGVCTLSTALHNCNPSDRWHGTAVRTAATLVYLAGTTANTPIAAIEAAVALPLGAAGLAINYLMCNNQNQLLQKHSLKCLSYGLHCIVVSDWVIKAIVFGYFVGAAHICPKSHTLNAAGHHFLHFIIPAVVQVAASFFAHPGAPLRDQATALAAERIINLMGENGRHVIDDLRTSFQRDLKTIKTFLPIQLINIPWLRERIDRWPQKIKEALRSFDVTRFGSNSAYRMQIFMTLRAECEKAGLVAPVAEGENPLLIDLDCYPQAVRNYRAFLARLTKEAVSEIYHNPVLSSKLTAGERQGTARISEMDGAIFPQVAAYIQYNELNDDNNVPDNFPPKHAALNGRAAEVLRARTTLRQLTSHQQKQLVDKIFAPETQVTEDVQSVYQQISRLSTALYTGPLMNETVYNLEKIISGDGNSISETSSLFEEWWTEGLIA